MFEWHKSVQKMIDIIEEHLTSTITLEMIAEKLNYSPYYCTRQFHQFVGVSLRNYIRLRKVSAAALDLRDTNDRILDIAFKYGFSSQEAFSRSFRKEYGLSPFQYRKMLNPLPLFIKRNTYNPYYLGVDIPIKEINKKEVNISIQVIPKHQFIGIRDSNTDNYFDFWTRQENKFKRDCYEVSGLLESIKSYNGIVGGWFNENKQKGYLYGVEVPCHIKPIVPDYFEKITIPKSLYVIFHYPPYRYNEEDSMVFHLLKEKMESFNPNDYGYDYHLSNPIYQRHKPEKYGQAICVPVKI